MQRPLQELAPIDSAAGRQTAAATRGALDLGRIPPAGGLASAGLLAVALAMLLATAWAAYIDVPFSDAHTWIAGVFKAEQTGDWLGYAWRPYNAQRIPLALVAQALDIEAVHGRAPVFLLGSAALWLCGGASVLALIVRSHLPAPTRTWGVAAMAMLLFNARLAEDAALPVFSVYLFVAGPALASAAIMQAAPRQGLATAALWIAAAFAFLSCCGNAAGLVIWPALIVAALLQGRGREQVLALSAASAVGAIAIDGGLGLPVGAGVAASSSAVDHLQRMAVYFCTFGGAPWVHLSDSTPVDVLVGAVVWLLAAVTVARARRAEQGAADPVVMAGVALILFGFGAAVLATLGRVDEGVRPIAPTRYAPFATVLQAGLILGSARSLSRMSHLMTAAGAVVLIAAVFLLDLHEMREIRHVSRRIRSDSLAFDRGAPPSANGFVMSPTPEFAHDIRSELARRGLPN